MKVQKIIAWIMLVVMGVNCFGGHIQPGVRTVKATDYETGDYEKASEEAEETIRAAEKAAGINVDGAAGEDAEQVVADESDVEDDATQEATVQKSVEEKGNGVHIDTTTQETTEEVYEDMTISSVTTLSEDMEVGNLQVNSELHLNGHKLVVHGDITLGSGLHMEEGYLVVEGDFTETYYAGIAMDSYNDYIQIQGNYIYANSYYGHHNRNKGTIEIWGNIQGTDGAYCNRNIVHNVECKVVLNGTKEQVIDIDTHSGFVIKHLVITNSSEEGVLSKHMLPVEDLEDEENKLHYPIDGSKGMTLTEDTTIEGDFCLLEGTLDLAGYSMQVKGNFIHAGGTIHINGGTLTIEGDYKKSLTYEEEEVIEDYSLGRLIMDQETDYVLIKGDYLDCGRHDTKEDWIAGTMELQGSVLGSETLQHPLLHSSGTHTTKLSGNAVQVLQTGSIAYDDTFSFAHLVVEQGEQGSAEWTKDVVVKESVAHHSGNIDGRTIIAGARIESTVLYGDCVINTNYTFEKDITFAGTLTLEGVTVTLSDKQVTVKGDYYHNNANFSMMGERARLILEQDWIVGNNSRNVISNGTYYVGGNISGSHYLAFQEGTVVHFIGTSEQRVAIPHVSTLFTNVVVDNPAGVVVEDKVFIMNVTCTQGVLSYASGGVHGFTVEEDGEYEGDLVIAGGVLDLNGHSFHVKGNLTVAGGALHMTQEQDYLLVDGDFSTTSSLDHSKRLTSGTLEVKGDFSQSGSAYAYKASEEHKVIFSGDSAQMITMTNPEYSTFVDVVFDNPEQIVINKYMYIEGIIEQSCAVEGAICLKTGADLADGTYEGNVSIVGPVVMEQDWHIKGDVRVEHSASIALNGNNLIIDGDMRVIDYGAILMQHGYMECESLTLQSNSSHYFDNEDDRLKVHKTLTVERTGRTFNKGHIQVQGDVQMTSNQERYWGEELCLELNGTIKQTITMNGTNHRFGKVLCNNTSEDGIYIEQDFHYASIDNTANSKITFSNGGVLGYTLQQDEVIDGDFILCGGVMDLNGYTLTVQGDLLQSCGVLDMNGGKLVVEGDYALANWDKNEEDQYTFSRAITNILMDDAAESILVKGSFHNYTTLSLSEGTLQIDGDWNERYTFQGNNLTIRLSGDVYWSGYSTCVLKNNCTTIFQGDSVQNLRGVVYYIDFGDVVIDNPEGLKLPDASQHMNIAGELETKGKPIDGWVYLTGTVKEDSITADVHFPNDMNLDKDLVIDGNGNLGRLNLNGYHLTVMGDCTSNYSRNNYVEQKSGVLEVKGNLVPNKYYAYRGLENNKVILSGDKKQTIYASNFAWRFRELVIANTSEEGVYSEEYLFADIITDPEGKLSFPTEGVTGYTLTKDTVVQGDMNLLAGTLDLNGYKLTVMGDFTQRGGTVDLHQGKLHVMGDYVIGDFDDFKNYRTSYPTFLMDDEEEYVYVEGDMIFACGSNLGDTITAGTIELKGNCIYEMVNGSRHMFNKNVRVILSGTQKQTIHNRADANYLQLGILEIQNTSSEGVVFANYMRIENSVIGSEKLHGTAGMQLCWTNGETPLFEQWEGNLQFATATTLENNLNVAGTLTLDANLDVNGYHMTAENIQLNQGLTLNGGIVQVKKNITFGTNWPVLTMSNEKDILQIYGNLTTGRGVMNLVSGQMDVKGNINLSGITVNTGETHTLTLSGKMTAKGTANIQTVTVAEGIVLNKLVLNKPRDYYVFNRDVEGMCKELIEDIQDIIAPSVPEGLTATEITCTKAKLSWQAASDDMGVAGYDIYRNEKKIMSVSGTSYTDKNLTPGTEYCYYVVAKDATSNTSAVSKTVTITTLEDEEAPTIPVQPEITQRMGTALKFTWTASMDNVQTTGYRIYRDGEEIATTTRAEYIDTGLTPNQKYAYTITAFDAAGNESEASEVVGFYTQAVEIGEISPANYSELSGNTISVSFINAGSSEGYQVYIAYRESGNEEYQEIYEKTLGQGTAYRKSITATATLDVESIQSEEIEVLVRITDAGGYEADEVYTYYLDRTAPSRLDEVSGELRDGVAVISYAKGTEVDIVGYSIYRQVGDGDKELLADITDVDKTYYYDKTMEEGVTYTYYVAAYDKNGYMGELSEPVTLTCDVDTGAPVIERVEPIEGILSKTAEITITASDNKALSKAVVEVLDEASDQYQTYNEYTFENGVVKCNLDTTAYKEEVTLRITVWDAAGNQAEYSKTYPVDNNGPVKISNLSASITSTTAILSWDAPTEEDFSYFLLEEKQEDSTWKEIGRTTTVTGYALEGLLPQSSHTYRVTAVDIRENIGTPSEELTITIGEDTIAPRIISVSPGGGYYAESIPLQIKAYDNIALQTIYIEYSIDQENWNTLLAETLSEPQKEYTLTHDFVLEELADGDVYIRAYSVDTAGNTGEVGQILIQYKVDTTAPSAISNLTAEGIAGSIHLSWSEPVENDIAAYRIYRSIEGLNSYQCIADSVTTLGYYDRTAAFDVSYTYKVTAVDKAGNESEYSNVVGAQKLPDDEIPVIYSLVPAEDAWIAGTYELSAYVADNDRISSVEFALKENEDDATKMVVDTVTTNISNGTVTCELDTTAYANGVYQVMITAKDASGNVSETYTSLCHISNVTLPAPQFSVVEGNWCVHLHYAGIEGESYVVYKKKVSDEEFSILTSGTGSLLYKDTTVSPDYTYEYKILVEDRAGNSIESTTYQVTPVDVDDMAPTAQFFADTAVIEGYQIVFNGLQSSDGQGEIASYEWDFGDGSATKSGPTPIHSYNEAGEYNVTLTVTDSAGNTDDSTMRITVLPKDSAGTALVEVRNASGTPLKDVTVFVNTSSDKNDMYTTNKSGKTTIMQKPGTYRVALYKPGYVATEVSVEIELHGETSYVFILQEGETVTADFQVRQLTFEEIVAAGIDLSDPANQHVFTVDTKLAFSGATRAEEDDSYFYPARSVRSSDSSKSSSSESKPEESKPEENKPTSGDAASEEEEEEVEPEIYYNMHISKSISWLKDMYEATLIVYNNANSQTIVAKDLTTTLLLPSGVSLAGTKEGQSATQTLPDIRGGECQAVSWYVRGDTPGKYKLQAALNGTLQPFNKSFACNFTSNEFDVSAGDGLVLTIQPEDRAEQGEEYYVYFTLSNEGMKEFYNVKTTFGTSHTNSKRYIAATDASKVLPVMSAGDVVAVNCLKPGESISGIYKTVVPVAGTKYENYMALAKYEYDVIAGSNLGVRVKIAPTTSHVPVPDLTYKETTDENSEADPVNVSTGAYTDSLSALSVQGVNPVSASLQYDSNAVEEVGEFGYGWTHNYEARIMDMKDGTLRYYVSPTGYYTFLAEDIEQAEYKQDSDGYLYMDPDSIPMKQNYNCLNENKAGYVLKRTKDGEFRLTDKADTVMEFDKSGNLTTIHNADGKRILIEREKEAFVVVDAISGRKLTYHLNDEKLVEKVTDDNGREVYFYYDENKNLKQFTNALGENTYYTYDKDHRILTVTNDEGNTYVTNEYEEFDHAYLPDQKVTRVVLQKDALGNETKFSYKEDEQTGDLVTTVTTRSGKTKKTITDAYGNVTCNINEAGDETRMTYDGEGNQTAVNNANGYSVTYDYDENGNMTTIRNSLMNGDLAETVMTYDGNGNMVSMENCNGESMGCTYYDNGLIKSVTDQNGNSIEYSYNNSGQITQEKDAKDCTIVYNYSNGDLIRVKDKNGNVTEYTYNSLGLVETTTIHDGSQTYTTTTYYDDLGRVDYSIDTEGGITSYEYDCAGNIISRTDAGGAMTVYQYDDNYQLVKETVYSSEEEEYTTSTTDYTYTKEGLLKTVTDGISGTVITNSYDKIGNKTKEVEKTKDGTKLSEIHYEYDKAGNVTKQTQVCLAQGATEEDNLSVQYKYFPNGKLNYVIDETGTKTTYSYDKSWRVQTIVSDTEPTVTYTYYPNGTVKSETVGGASKEQIGTSYTYDIYGNVLTATDPKGNVTTYRYDGNGNLVETEDATHRVFYSRYDALNRVVETGVRKPGDSENIPLSYVEYNIRNHTITETDAVKGGSITTHYDTAGRPYKTTNAENVVLSETIYDTEGRILQTVDAKGMVTENVYNNLMQIEKVRTGEKKGDTPNTSGKYEMTGEVRETAYTYDALGRTTKVTEGSGADQTVSSVVFDGLGRIESMKDPNQNASKNPVNTYEYTYDSNGLLIQEKNAIGNITEYQYNANLLLESVKDSANETTSYQYDSLNRLTKVKDALGTIEYVYDDNGNITEVTETKSLFEDIIGAGKTIHREYDSLNRVLKYTDYNGREVSYGYDPLGNLIALTYPGGEIVRYEYNPDGLVKSMTSKSGETEYIWSYAYDGYGRLTSIIRPDGTAETRSYDVAGQLTEQVDKDAEGNIFQKNTYTYNVFGEVTEKTTSNAGDITSLETVSMTYDDANRLVTYNGQAVTYDSKGNMTYGPVDGKMQALTYDCRNRLIEAGGVTYTYDAENTRIATTENGKTTEYVTDTGGSLSKLLTAYEADGTETNYYYGAEGLAGQYNDGTKKRLFYHYDNIGSTTCVTDLTGTVIERFSYGTYGELLTTVKNKIRFLYNGAYGVATDSNGLYYMRARYYNPDIKRFINQDIKVGDIGSGQSLNRYAYCEGNPVSLIDPFGLSPEGTQDQGAESKYQWLHNALDVAGFVFDGADIINAAIYAAEKDWKNAALCAATAIPVVGAAVVGVVKGAKAVIKAKKAAKIAELATEASKMTKTAANTLDTLADTMKASTKYGDSPLELMNGVTAEASSDLYKALETGQDFGKTAKKTSTNIWESNMAYGTDGIRLSTSAGDGASLLKSPTFKTGGVGGSVTKGGKKTTVDLYSFGNSKGPRGARPVQDFNVESFDDIVGPESGPLPKGASNVLNVNDASLKGHYYVLPAGTKLPDGLDIIADGSDVVANSPHGVGHYTIFPTKEMTVDKFNELYKSLPWKFGGKKK